MLLDIVSLKKARAVVVSLFVLSGTAVAQELEVSTSFTLTSDWEWRGISLTRAYPSAYGSITASSSGFYAGLFGGSWDSAGDGNVAMTAYAGYGGDIGSVQGLSYTVEGSYNTAFGDPRSTEPMNPDCNTRVDNTCPGNEDVTWFGLWAGLTYSQDAFSLTGRAYYDYYGSIYLDGNGSGYLGNTHNLAPDPNETEGIGTKGALYVWGNASYTVEDFTLGVDVGRFIQALDGLPPYLHYGVTASYNVGYGTVIGAKWYANDIRIDSAADDRQTGTGGRFLFYISTNLDYALGMTDHRG